LPDTRGGSLTLLDDGRVLYAGGKPDEYGVMSADAWLFDPGDDTWTEIDPMPGPRRNHAASLLPGGDVLLAGGDNDFYSGRAFDECLLFDPILELFSLCETLPSARAGAASSALPDGRVLLVGGKDDLGQSRSDAAVYDPEFDSWSSIGSDEAPLPFEGRSRVARLSDGSVVAYGAPFPSILPETLYQDGVQFDPDTLDWMAMPRLDGRRVVTLASDSSQVYAFGGIDSPYALLPDTAALLPGDDGWLFKQDAPFLGADLVAVWLPSDVFLVAPMSEDRDDAALYDPDADAWISTSQLPAVSAGQESAVLLDDGRVLLTGGAISGSSSEGVAPPMVYERGE